MKVDEVSVSLANHPNFSGSLKLLHHHLILNIVSKVWGMPFLELDSEGWSAKVGLLNLWFGPNWHWRRSQSILELDLVAKWVYKTLTHSIIRWGILVKIHSSDNLCVDFGPIHVKVNRWFTLLICIIVQIVVLYDILTNIDSETFWIFLVSSDIDKILRSSSHEISSHVIILSSKGPTLLIFFSASRPVATSPIIYQIIIPRERSQANFLSQRKLVKLMNVQENVDVLVLDSKEIEDISCPVHFIFHHFFEKHLDIFQSLLGWLVKDLGYIDVLDLTTSGDFWISWEASLHTAILIDGLII